MALEEISPFHIAVVDAVMSLSRLRIRKDGPFYITRPKDRLFIRTLGQDSDFIKVCLTCKTWGDTEVRLELANGSVGGWLAWGDVKITYGKSAHHPGLAGSVITTYLQPSFVTSAAAAGLPMRYRVRPRVIR